jgi:phenylpropionate dioxygenase-like ring-hydroxylating dioxygenase large terminal subunit
MIDAATRRPPPHSTFEAEAWNKLARCWYAVGRSEDVGEAPYKAMLLDEPLVLYRVKGELVVARDVCAHRGVPLTLGKADGNGIVCLYHGLRYGVGGLCNLVPSSPDQKIPSRLKLVVYPAVERYGLIWTCVKAFAGRQVEGFLDVAHFAWIHTKTFADPNKAEVPDYMPVETEKGFVVDYRSNIGNYPIGVDGRAQPGFEWLRHFELHLPFTATLTIHFPDDARLVIMNSATPVSALKTTLFAPVARNFDQHLPVADVHAFNFRIFEEDRAVVESQQPEYLPLDFATEAHIPADRSSMAYRKGLKRMGFNQFF